MTCSAQIQYSWVNYKIESTISEIK